MRISGSRAFEVARRIFDRPLTESRRLVFGRVIKGGVAIDEALGCRFDAPRSYTGEDVVEVHCHGGAVVCRMVLEAALEAGAAPAEAGAFTRRAFLNGRLDLAQAEAVGDLLSAKTEAAVHAAAGQLGGKLSGKLAELRQAALDVSAHLLASLDFPDEVDGLPPEALAARVRGVHSGIGRLLATADDGRIIKNGVNVVITGAPNVGKSSLLNAIVGEDRAIVTDAAGTTRDVIETAVNIRGCLVNLLDTAGIRSGVDEAEALGVARARAAAEKADLVLLVVDGTVGVRQADAEAMGIARGRNTICLVNKCDLPCMEVRLPGFDRVVPVSAKTGEGLDALFSVIEGMYARGGLAGETVVTGERHRQALVRAGAHTANCLTALDAGCPPDIALTELELCIAALGEITGASINDEIVDHIFANFCVGK